MLVGLVIEHHDLTIPVDSASIFTPWYALANGSPCGHSDSGALPQSVASVAANLELRTFHAVQSSAPRDKFLALPAYKLRSGTLLLLDGNHRVVATQVDGSTLSLALFVVCGPLDSVVLPDLGHWV